MPANLLTLEPSRDLVFPKTPQDAPVPRMLKLLNTTNGFVAFRLKTTATKAFVTKPGSAVLPAGGTMDVQILLQQGQGSAADNQRFLVEAIATDNDDLIPKDKWSTFKRGEVVQYRLSVLLRDEPLPIAPEEVIEDPRIAELRLQLEQEQDLRKTLQARITELERMLAEAKAERQVAGEEAEAEKAELERKLAESDAENKRLAAELEAQQKAGSASQQALKDLEQRLAVEAERFEKELEAKRQETADLEQQLKQVKAELHASLQGQGVSAELEKQLGEATEAFAEIQRQLREAKTETEGTELKLGKANATIDDLQKQLGESQTGDAQRDVFLKQISELEMQLRARAAANEKLQQSQTASAEVAAELKRQVAALAEAMAEIESLKRQLAESEADRGQGTATRTTAHGIIATQPNADLERQLREAMEERARVEQELAEQRSITGYIHSQLPQETKKSLHCYVPIDAPTSWPAPPPLPGNTGFAPRKWYTEDETTLLKRQLAEAEQARADQIAELKRQLAEATQELADQCNATAYIHSQLPEEKKQSTHRYVPINAPASWPSPPKLPGNTGFVPRKWYSEQDLADVEKKLDEMRGERDEMCGERDNARQRAADLERRLAKPEVKGCAACVLCLCPCFAGFACLQPAAPAPRKVAG